MDEIKMEMIKTLAAGMEPDIGNFGFVDEWFSPEVELAISDEIDSFTDLFLDSSMGSDFKSGGVDQSRETSEITYFPCRPLVEKIEKIDTVWPAENIQVPRARSVPIPVIKPVAFETSCGNCPVHSGISWCGREDCTPRTGTVKPIKRDRMSSADPNVCSSRRLVAAKRPRKNGRFVAEPDPFVSVDVFNSGAVE